MFAAEHDTDARCVLGNGSTIKYLAINSSRKGLAGGPGAKHSQIFRSSLGGFAAAAGAHHPLMIAAIAVGFNKPKLSIAHWRILLRDIINEMIRSQTDLKFGRISAQEILDYLKPGNRVPELRCRRQWVCGAASSLRKHAVWCFRLPGRLCRRRCSFRRDYLRHKADKNGCLAVGSVGKALAER